MMVSGVPVPVNGDDHDNGTPILQPKGVLGDGALHAGKYNMALVRRAIKKQWPIDRKRRQAIVDQMALIVDQGEEARDKIAAAKVLVSADAVNAKRESMVLGTHLFKPTELHQHVHVELPAYEHRTVAARILARIEQRRAGESEAGNGTSGNGDAGGNGSG